MRPTAISVTVSALEVRARSLMPRIGGTVADSGAATAATAFGLVGIGQVAGRAFFAFGRSTTTVPAITAVCTAAVLALAGFAAGAVVFPAAVGLAVLAGAARGSLTLGQASVVVDRWGTANTGHLTGLFAAPVTIVKRPVRRPGGGDGVSASETTTACTNSRLTALQRAGKTMPRPRSASDTAERSAS